MRSKNSIFTFKDISLLWNETNINLIKRRINYYLKTGKLYHLRRGIYAKDKNYDKFELATKIYTPSYISFETVLTRAGIVFQYYSQIFVASYLTREIIVDGQKYSYKKIKDEILTNPLGIENKENYFIASPERAFLDTLYLYKDYHFDNLSPLNLEKVFEILPIYKNKTLEKKIKKIYMSLDIATHKNVLIKILKDIYTNPTLGPILGFKGGSAVYLFYGLNRFSVDLDFDLLQLEKKIMFSNASKKF